MSHTELESRLTRALNGHASAITEDTVTPLAAATQRLHQATDGRMHSPRRAWATPLMAAAAALVALSGTVLAIRAASDTRDQPAVRPTPPAPTSTLTPTIEHTPTHRAPSTTAATRCGASDVHVGLTRGGVAAGTVTTLIRFTNKASSPCTLRGWPTVLEVSAGTSLAARKVTDVPGVTAPDIPATVTLAPGASAFAGLSASDEPAPGHSVCPPELVSLLVSVPGSATPIAIKAAPPGIGNLPSCSRLAVTAIVDASQVYVPQ